MNSIPKIRPNSVLECKPIPRVDLEQVKGVLVRTDAEDDSKRQLSLLFKKETAADFIGRIEPAFHRWGFSKGQFSLIDIIENLQSQLGRIDDFAVSTWTIAAADLSRLHALISPDKISRARFLVDLSFQRRQPALIGHIRNQFGSESIRVTKNHAKFITFAARDYRIVVRTSMNLNLNPRFEDIEIKDDPKLYAFLDEILRAFFQAHDAKAQAVASVKDLSGEFSAHGAGNREGLRHAARRP